MTSVRIAVADIEVEIVAAGAKAADLAAVARAELDHALEHAHTGQMPPPGGPIGFHTGGFHTEIAPPPPTYDEE